MADPDFTLADPARDRDALLALNVEYVSWVTAGIEQAFGITPVALLGMPVVDYVPSVLAKVCGEPPPRGAFYLVRLDGEVAGMGGVRRLREGMGEIKRLYVRPTFRGRRLGETILARLLDDARAFGLRHVVLDSAPFMQSAHRRYEAAGFVDRAPYEGVEVPSTLHGVWRFMERTL